MAKLKNKTQGFTVVNNSILRDKTLSIKERGLLITLLSLPNNWEFSVYGLTKILPDGKDAISATLKKLEAAGYLKRIQAKNENGQFNGYDWEITDNKKEDLPITENPKTATPETESTISENPTQSNTNPSNTNLSNTVIINPSFIHQPGRTESKDKAIRAELEILIGYECLKDDNIALDLFELCVEICVSSDDIKVNGRIVPSSIFQSKIKKLYYEDLIRISEQIRQQEHTIKNIRAYMLTALYNENTVSNTYWSNRVAVDMRKS